MRLRGISSRISQHATEFEEVAIVGVAQAHAVWGAALRLDLGLRAPPLLVRGSAAERAALGPHDQTRPLPRLHVKRAVPSLPAVQHAAPPLVLVRVHVPPVLCRPEHPAEGQV